MDVTELRKLDGYLKRLFTNPGMRVVPRPQRNDMAEIYNKSEFLGVLTVDDEDEDRSYNFRMEIPLGAAPKEDIQRVTLHMREKLGQNIRVKPRPMKTDSFEAYVGDEFVGVLFVEQENKARSCILEMAILDVDLEDGEAA